MDDSEIGPALAELYGEQAYISGYGPRAVWEVPDGKGGKVRAYQFELANQHFGQESPYYTAKQTPEKARTYSGAGLPAGYVQGSDGIVYKQDSFGGLLPASRDEIAAINAPPPPRASTAAPAQPHIQVAPNGDVIRIDPYSGVPATVGNIPALAQQPDLQTFTAYNGNLWTRNPKTGATQDTGVKVANSPDEVRQFQLEDRQAQEAFASKQQAGSQAFSAGQSALDRAQRLQEQRNSLDASSANSAADRAQRASEFAATYGLNAQDRKLAAARQLSDVISNTDPAAIAAFSKAGGGNLFNATAAGNSALSTGALLPAARTLEAIQGSGVYAPTGGPSYFDVTHPGHSAEIAGEDPSLFTPEHKKLLIDQQRGAEMAKAYNANPTPPAGTNSATEAQATNPLQYRSEAATQADAAKQRSGALSDALGIPRLAYGTRMPRYATGTFLTGDSTDPADPAAGGAHPEAVSVFDPPGPHNAKASVTPLTPPGVGDTRPTGDTARVAALFDAISEFLHPDDQSEPMPGGGIPRFAFGTDLANPFDPASLATPDDQAALDEIKQLRQSVDITPPVDGGYFSAGFSNLAPSIQRRYFGALQARTGAAAGDFEAEAQRYRMPGTSQSAFTLGY